MRNHIMVEYIVILKGASIKRNAVLRKYISRALAGVERREIKKGLSEKLSNRSQRASSYSGGVDELMIEESTKNF